ncbi:ParB/Srx family N-terminal domain-containing protein [Vibrio furnissii]|uniref:ParB/Srx family N-terminal domain-containing protein n=1 Tax=Vibrio furnissii TaxID=29494 RepID=UPI000200E2DB|nr:ParB/Srx family N-terminal domain-containing protein [Vibrio furnissii]ADT89588.1 hypothetical ParB-like nuclease [Vibrio furnissii NCTC 11218]
MNYSALLLTLLTTLSTSTWAVELTQVHQGEVISVTLSELKPTQPSVGYDQIYYKLGRYQHDAEKQFDEICEANGQKGVSEFDAQSQPAVATSFQCKEPVGTERQDMKTVVIAPNNQLYLTDGHHTFNTFWHMDGGGSAFPIHVLVDKDYRALSTMAAFWKQLALDKNTWLFDVNDLPISYQQLPTELGMDNFADDPYRSLMYFARDVSWDKPAQPVPFLEFYWAKQLKPQLPLAQFDLNTEHGYLNAIETASQRILAEQSLDIGGSGLSAKAMGQFDHFDAKKFKKLSKQNSKLSYMLGYKTAQQ